MPPIKTFGERIADALVEDGLLSAQQVDELLQQQKKEGTRLIKLLIRLRECCNFVPPAD